MAETKYSSMPGIDIYETSDLPEADQQIFDGSRSDAIESVDLPPSKAFERFEGKSFHQNDPTGGQRAEYEILGEGSDTKETPEQRYSRLQHEIRELSEAISRTKETTKADNAAQSLTPVMLAKQVENMSQLLAELGPDKQFGVAREVNLTDPYGAFHKRLMSELDQFKSREVKSQAAKSKSMTPAATPVDPDHVAYQLFYHPEQTKFDNSARVADLEQRLDRLETLLGNPPDKITVLTSELTSKSLLGAVSMLSAKARLMDPSLLDQMDSRLAGVSQKLVQLSEKKEVLEQQEKLNKVAELYDIIDKWNGYSLPLVVDRLSALRELHNRALGFRQTLKQLEMAQEQIGSQLKTESELLTQVQSTAEKNLASIQANYESLASRIKALCESSATKS